MNPVKKLEKKYPQTYQTFLKVVGNPQTGRAKTLAAMLLRVDEVERRLMEATREDQTLHDYFDAPLNQEVRDERCAASRAYTDLCTRLAEAGFPSNVLPILH